MTAHEPFEAMLTGGHPNSLGRTIEVVATIDADPTLLQELVDCYFSSDEVVRLRVSSAMKRTWRAHPDWVIPYIDRFLTEIARIPQASTQWTLATLFLELDAHLTPEQRRAAVSLLQRNLESWDDWIVLNNTMETLSVWAQQDADLRAWLLPHLDARATDSRKSVAARAQKFRAMLLKAK
ncbi:MAG: hypothetical protein SGJ24_15700 [Chloroflexota bacterium]|nr:hypothetical protein [Chloroflexota bacterium]